MSLKEGLFEAGEQSAYGDDRGDSTESLTIPESQRGLFGRLKRRVREWPQRYVEMRVDARTRRSN
jgi:hypothetical protein